MLRMVFCIIALLALSSNPAFAGKKKKGIAVSLSELSQYTLPNGKVIWCYQGSEESVYGNVKDRDGQLFFVETKLNKRMKKLRKQYKDGKLSKKKFRKKKKRTRNKHQEKILACNDELPGATPGAGSGGGGATSAEVSLAPLSRRATGADLRYLLEKAAFGNSDKEYSIMQAGLQNGLQAAIDELFRVKAEPVGLSTRMKDTLDGRPDENDPNRTPEFYGMNMALLDLYINTNNPVYEKLALFLLSTWTTGSNVLDRSSQRYLMWDYISMLRRYAKNPDLRSLAREATEHPMMLLYLDGATNQKQNPNENYAREFMELFTTGPRNLDGQPNYTETPFDMTSLALAFTGHRVIDVVRNEDTEDEFVEWIPVYSMTEHAVGDKTLFTGKSYECVVDDFQDVINCVFDRHPNVSIYYAEEILKYYLTPNPPRELIEALAREIKRSNFNLLPVLKKLFASEAFHHAVYKDTLVKNSIEFAVEFIRTLKIPVDIRSLESQLDRMQMPITETPSVFWWDRETWTSPSVAMERANLISRLFRDRNTQQGEDELNPLWTPADVLPKGDEVYARDVAKFVASRLGVTLTSDQEDSLVFYMTHSLNNDGEYELESYDNRIEGDQRYKGLGVYFILALTPDFQLG